jgi:hypothetical protein
MLSNNGEFEKTVSSKFRNFRMAVDVIWLVFSEYKDEP